MDERSARRIADAAAGIARSFVRQATALERIASAMEAANRPEATEPPPEPIQINRGD